MFSGIVTNLGKLTFFDKSEKVIAINSNLKNVNLGDSISCNGICLTVSKKENKTLFFNVSEEVIGLSIVAVGTSLPELATTFAAARRNQGEVVLGNIIGSNLFNILFIVGVASLISPIKFQEIDLVQSLGYLFISVVFLLSIVIKPRIIGRNWGAVFLLSYASYLWLLVY